MRLNKNEELRADLTHSSHHYRKLILSAKCCTAPHFTINKSCYWSPIIHHGAHYQSLKLTEAQVELSLGYKLQSVTRVISRTRCGIPPSPTALTQHCPVFIGHAALGSVYRGRLVTVSTFTETDNVVRMCTPHLSFSNEGTFSLAHFILIAVIESGNLLQPWGDVNDVPQTRDKSGVHEPKKGQSNFSKSLTINFLLMFNSRQNRH